MWKQEYTNMFECEDVYWWYRGIHELIDRFVRRESADRELSILDAGCGTGKLMTILRRYGTATGLDASDEAVRYCRQRGIHDVVIQDLNTWEPALAAYDVITCIDVLCHSAIGDVASVLSKFHRGLKPNGIVVLNLPAFKILARQHDIVVRTVRRCRKADIVPLLEKEGFQVEMAIYRLPFLFVIILMRKLIGIFRPPETPASDLRPLPSTLNALLLLKHRVENIWISAGLWVPFGSSLFVVARKVP